ncbi:hypothetical protein AVEN_169652-1 [Araneus ventricosus]|uniref:ATP-dependent DNA helicase n=1 Tax=Araneus ventricosus TaxID=182803 RepID=A0A4Y2R700_ARAVE|nr:hypothetical protein AVEN_246046-1 [Araneus ventricosus]GBN71074.1 hypothetical protein AVEN_15799-1 [Araneus ventricosus]GBN71117.1 hypothetical protein AVEN_168006-1 [Araneus ventricosus]GBN71120.1 hypothetical protein AVEN_169652-1 [Araneus ventricosus]
MPQVRTFSFLEFRSTLWISQFQFIRLQFPVRYNFAMSINRAQGQSLKVVGLDFLKPWFSHGQLYVGSSRVVKADNLYILAPNGGTADIVYLEAL